MSSIVKFFVATKEEALRSLASGPDSSSALSFGNFDAEEALLDWESRLTGSSFESLVSGDLPEVVAEVEDGATVLLLSGPLVESLAGISDLEVDELVRWWAELTVGIELPAASAILKDLVCMIREARNLGKSVYCWVG
ncbi:hypothetical protein [Melissospora conviva]|uniref:hypothetical protein n=1 Tax=Melissospora conviva TaxID=3388432 RepID=UPI003C23EA75